MMLLSILTLLLWIVLACATGVVIHEFAHYAVAYMLNCEPRIVHPSIDQPTIPLSTSWLTNEDRAPWRDTAIAAAPTLAAMPLLGLWVAMWVVAGELHLPALACALATGKPSPSDYHLIRQRYDRVTISNKQDETLSKQKKPP